jgi:hypothetical protein
MEDLLKNTISDIQQEIDKEFFDAYVKMINAYKKSEFVKEITSKTDNIFNKAFLEEI